MDSSLAQIIQTGNDITAFKYYGVTTVTILCYEYLAMLPDEIKYAWSFKKTWVFYLFLLNRYIPVVFMFWYLNVSYGHTFPKEFCNKTAFISTLEFTVCTLLAQTVLTLRIYAVTGRNKKIAALFTTIAGSQLAIGIYLAVRAVIDPVVTLPPIPFDAFRVCISGRHRKFELAYTFVSLAYDLFAFLAILYAAGRSAIQKFGILGTIVRDATAYFIVICTAHFVLVVTLLFARPSLQLLPAPGNAAYLPVMITRLMISLRKAANARDSPWSMVESTSGRSSDHELRTVQFATMGGVGSGPDDSIYSSSISPRV